MNGGLLAREVSRDLIMQFLCSNDEPEPSEINLDRSLLPECGRYSATLAELDNVLKSFVRSARATTWRPPFARQLLLPQPEG
jgi:hypothetical protein